MLKQDFTLQVLTDHCLEEKIKKGQIMKEFVGLSAKIYNYLKSNSYEDKRAKGTKICVINRKCKIYRLWKLFRTSSN